MKQKKTYIAPNLTCLQAEFQSIMAGSKENKETWDLANKWKENGDVEEDADLPINSKQHDAWSSWDE